MNNETTNLLVIKGIDELFKNTNIEPNREINLDDIEIRDQIRAVFTERGQELEELGASLQKFQIQAIFVRPNNDQNAAKPYILVAGERRVRAAKLVGMKTLRAHIAELTAEEANEMQFAENIHRLNLTQLEEAEKINHDLQILGSVEAVLAKHKKSQAWLSKTLSLLDLPTEARKLIDKDITSDKEVILGVAKIQLDNPAKAKHLVETLQANKGKDARKIVAAARKEGKPPRKTTPPKLEITSDAEVITPSDTETTTPEATIETICIQITKDKISPQEALEKLTPSERENIENTLRLHYDFGIHTKNNVGGRILQGLQNGTFGISGMKAIALVAFIDGATQDTKFNMLNIFGGIKQ